MKKQILNVFAAFALCAVIATGAFAGEKTKEVTFGRDVNINGTVVKKGTYKVAINEQTGEMSIRDGKKTLVTTKFTTTDRENAARNTEVNVSVENGTSVLKAVTFGGEKKTVVVGQSVAATPNQ